MKNMLRASRRHHAVRLKRARCFYSGMDNRSDPRRLGKLLHTPALCSCWMCGNQRPFAGPTIAELLHRIELAEQSARDC